MFKKLISSRMLLFFLYLFLITFFPLFAQGGTFKKPIKTYKDGKLIKKESFKLDPSFPKLNLKQKQQIKSTYLKLIKNQIQLEEKLISLTHNSFSNFNKKNLDNFSTITKYIFLLEEFLRRNLRPDELKLKSILEHENSLFVKVSETLKEKVLKPLLQKKTLNFKNLLALLRKCPQAKQSTYVHFLVFSAIKYHIYYGPRTVAQTIKSGDGDCNDTSLVKGTLLKSNGHKIIFYGAFSQNSDFFRVGHFWMVSTLNNTQHLHEFFGTINLKNNLSEKEILEMTLDGKKMKTLEIIDVDSYIEKNLIKVNKKISIK